jgi:hypothetical protein
MKQRLQRGQAAVEFAVFTIILVILLLIPIQLAWIGVQKWQFTHFGAVAARTYSVRTTTSANSAMITYVTPRAIGRGWALFSGLYVGAIPPMTASQATQSVRTGTGSNVSAQGVRVRGMARVIPIFKPFFGFSGPWGYSGWDALGQTTTRAMIHYSGFVQFEGFIPMEKEPTEKPNNKRRDNDCRGTPCEGGNGR